MGVITLTHDKGVSLFLMSLVACIGLSYRVIQKKGIVSLLMDLLVFSLSSLVVFFVVTNMEQRYLDGVIFESGDIAVSGVIVSRSDAETYEIKVRDTAMRLKSMNHYELGDNVWVTGNYVSGLTGSTRLDSAYVHTYQELSEDLRKLAVKLTKREFDYSLRLKMKGLYGVVYEKSSILQEHKSSKIRYSVRMWVQKSLFQYRDTPQAPSLLLGMLLGDRSGLTSEEYASFIDSGLVHIVAVSGGNIVMIVVFLSAALFFFPFYIRLAIILGVVLFFSWVVGSDSSVLRATIMGVLSIYSLLRGRVVQTKRLLAIAAVLMLLYNPWFLLYDIGFVFSFAAVVGLIKSSRYRYKKKLTGLSSILPAIRDSYVLPTLGASIGVFPFLLFFTDSFNLLSLGANILVAPLVPLLMIIGSSIVVAGDWGGVLEGVGVFLVSLVYKISDITVEYGVFVGVGNNVYMILLLLVWSLRMILEKENKTI